MKHSTVGSILRSDQAFYDQVTWRETLNHGIAFYNPYLPRLADTNQFREVLIERPGALEEAYGEAEDFFARQGVRCLKWAPAEGKRIEGLARLLGARGFVERVDTVVTLTEWVEVDKASDLRVLPARPMRAALRSTFEAAQFDGDEEQARLRRQTYEDRLDDPSFDMFVALREGQPVGRCALHQVGDIARVRDFYVMDHVREEDARNQMGRELLNHVIQMARRLQMRNICDRLPSDDAASIRLYRSMGFVPDGDIVEYERPAPSF